MEGQVHSFSCRPLLLLRAGGQGLSTAEGEGWGREVHKALAGPTPVEVLSVWLWRAWWGEGGGCTSPVSCPSVSLRLCPVLPCLGSPPSLASGLPASRPSAHRRWH